MIMDNSLKKVDKFMRISCRMRLIALQSAVMAFATTGYLSPVSGASRKKSSTFWAC